MRFRGSIIVGLLGTVAVGCGSEPSPPELPVHSQDSTASSPSPKPSPSHSPSTSPTPKPTSNTCLTFNDDFARVGQNAAIGNTWTAQFGSFVVTNDLAVSQDVTKSMATANCFTAADVGISADFNLNPSSGVNFNEAGLVARYVGGGEGSYYLATVNVSGGTNGVAIARLTNGVVYPIISGFIGITKGTMKFTVLGDELSLYVNGILALTAKDETLRDKGAVGIRGYSAGVSFGVFSASPL